MTASQRAIDNAARALERRTEHLARRWERGE
jgi:hypothetical protein